MVGEGVYGQGKVNRGIDGQGNNDRGKDVVPCISYVWACGKLARSRTEKSHFSSNLNCNQSSPLGHFCYFQLVFIHWSIFRLYLFIITTSLFFNGWLTHRCLHLQGG